MSPYTIAAGILAILIIIFLYIQSCFLKVEAGTLAITGWLGAKAETVFEPGWYFISWPFNQVITILDTTKTNFNLDPFEACCRMDIDVPPSLRNTSGIIPVRSPEISIYFQADFHGYDEKGKRQRDIETEKLNTFFELTDEKGKLSNKLVKEELNDFLTARLSALLRTMGINDLLIPSKEHFASLAKDLQLFCEQQNLPLRINSVKIAAPFRPTDKEITNAIQRLPQIALLRKAAEAEQELALFIATQQIEITERQADSDARRVTIGAQADAEKVRISASADAQAMATISQEWGINDLSKERRIEAWLAIRGLEAYQELAKSPGSTFVIDSSLTAGIKDIAKRFGFASLVERDRW